MTKKENDDHSYEATDGQHPYASYRDEKGRFYNNHRASKQGVMKSMGIFYRFLTEKKINTIPDKDIPVKPITRDQLQQLDQNKLHIIKLGHSSLLLKVYGKYWLLDPVFSLRASPFSFAGPKRFHETPISLEDLPEIDRVIISHNHYDHLDKAAVKMLASKTNQFYVPIGVDEELIRWKVPAHKLNAFDWWQEHAIEEGMLVFTPTQHFSGRAFRDSNKTLWGSWVMKIKEDMLFFSGDSGYFPGFKHIGDRYGPFHLTMVETGAYDVDWAHIHMQPEQSVQAHIDLKGQVMMPIHNGTFELAFHPWYEPLERAQAHAAKHDVKLVTPIVGEVLTLDRLDQSRSWWKDLTNSALTDLKLSTDT